MSSVQKRLTVRREGAVLVVVLDDPTRLNAITRDTLTALLSVLDAPEHAGAGAVVLTGAGRAFSAGQDLGELEQLAADPGWDLDEHLQLFQRVTERLLAEPRPTVAALNGVAVGFGAEVALACDVRVAADSARMGFVEVSRGLFQTNGVTWLLPRLVGHGRAADLLLTGQIVDAAALERWGLATRRCSDDALLAEAVAVATQLASGHPLSRSLVREALAVTWDSTLEQMMAREIDGMRRCVTEGAAAGGARAFLAER